MMPATVFLTELRRQRRRKLPYVLILVEAAVVAAVHRQSMPAAAGELQIDPEIYIIRQVLAGMPALIGAALLLSLPLIRRDELSGAQESVLMSGISEPAFVIAKFSAVMAVIGLLAVAQGGLSLVACAWRYGNAPLWEAARMLMIATMPPVFLAGAAGLLTGSLARHILVQLLGLAVFASGSIYLAFALLGRWDRSIPIALTDLMMTLVWTSLLELYGIDFGFVDVLQQEGTLDNYEWTSILMQRAVLMLAGLVLTCLACGIVRLRELDYSGLWRRKRMPFSSFMHRFLFLRGRGPAYWAVLVGVTAALAGIVAFFTDSVTARIEMLASVSTSPPGLAAASDGAGARVRIDAMSFGLTLGTRRDPVRGACEYRIADCDTKDLRLLLNTGLDLTAASIDGRELAVSRAADLVTLSIGSLPPGAHRLRTEIAGFVDNYYRTAAVRSRWRRLYHYLPTAPAVARTTTKSSYLMPDDRFFPIILASNTGAGIDTSIEVDAPAGWNVSTPAATTAVENAGTRRIHRFHGLFGQAEIERLSVIAGPGGVLSKSVSGRTVEIVCVDPNAISASQFAETSWDVGGFIAELDRGGVRPIQAIGMSHALQDDLSASAPLFLPFIERELEWRTIRWDVHLLMPTSCLTGSASRHPFFNGGLRQFLAATLRREVFGAAGRQRGASPVVPRAATSVDRGIVLAEWREDTSPFYTGRFSHRMRAGEKAERFLLALRYLLGADRMRRCIQKFLDEYRFEDPSPEDFIRIANTEAAAAKIDIDWFLDDYYRGACLPRIEIESEPIAWRNGDGPYTAVVRVENTWDGRVLAPIVIEMEGDIWRGQVFVEREGELRTTLPVRPRRVEVDPDGVVYRADNPASAAFRIVEAKAR